ncbi:hypothetical protein CRG98_030400 [Punica granatum]|uniref:Uncharacterized protein n=1 Tax=Punica granatum TaxID=22663 RepID=A0A2I0IYX9_PUNGR|nr:hypothetical protein CRG98_030400 [Punica granatum]
MQDRGLMRGRSPKVGSEPDAGPKPKKPDAGLKPNAINAGPESDAGPKPDEINAGPKPDARLKPNAINAGPEPDVGSKPNAVNAGPEPDARLKPDAGPKPDTINAGPKPDAGLKPNAINAGPEPDVGSKPNAVNAGPEPDAGPKPDAINAGLIGKVYAIRISWRVGEVLVCWWTLSRRGQETERGVPYQDNKKICLEKSKCPRLSTNYKISGKVRKAVNKQASKQTGLSPNPLDVPSGVAKLCAPEFYLVGARMREAYATRLGSVHLPGDARRTHVRRSHHLLFTTRRSRAVESPGSRGTGYT